MSSKERLRFAWNRWVNFLGIATLAAAVAALVMSYAPRIEAAWAPILAGTALRTQSVSPAGALVFTIAYTKRRPCTLAEIDWVGINAEGEYEYAYATDPAGKPIRAQSRPTGRNVSRPYHLYLTDDTVSFLAVVWHRCGLPWTSRQVVGPFDRWDR